jgi:phosphoglycolate phosphatase-like HAD superfamily hydrolase
MTTHPPTVLALDFDGVICDGLKEYFQTAWYAYAQVWSIDHAPTPELAAQFYRLRPVIETGWEMPLVLRALELGNTETEILQNWSTIAQHLVTQETPNFPSAPLPKLLAAAVDNIRDTWIATDLSSWLAEHRFYPGVIERLKMTIASPVAFFIISTKESRFIRQLLQREGIELGDRQVFGKETKRPKAEILRDLNREFTSPPIWFVEDRLKTLQSVENQSDLANVTLFLADWGYNTELERTSIKEYNRIYLLSLEQFSRDFATWLPAV